jgi:hypothetical protein
MDEGRQQSRIAAASSKRHLGAEALVLRRVLEEVDELHDLELGLVAAGHVLEGHVDTARLGDDRRLTGPVRLRPSPEYS